MDREFWLERWRTQQIGFHLAAPNPLLERYWPSLGVAAGAGVFVPLCGKSRDLAWLAERGHRVVGVELAEPAVRAFFEESGLEPRAGRGAALPFLESGNIRLFVGDFFALAPADLAGCSAVYDRAALMALPPDMRDRYVAHLHATFGRALPTLLIALEYDQARVPGPPFSVPRDEVARHFGSAADVEILCEDTRAELPPKFADAGVVSEVVYAIRPRSG